MLVFSLFLWRQGCIVVTWLHCWCFCSCGAKGCIVVTWLYAGVSLPVTPRVHRGYMLVFLFLWRQRLHRGHVVTCWWSRGYMLVFLFLWRQRLHRGHVVTCWWSRGYMLMFSLFLWGQECMVITWLHAGGHVVTCWCSVSLCGAKGCIVVTWLQAGGHVVTCWCSVSSCGAKGCMVVTWYHAGVPTWVVTCWCSCSLSLWGQECMVVTWPWYHAGGHCLFLWRQRARCMVVT